MFNSDITNSLQRELSKLSELLKTLITWILQDIRMTQLQSQFLIIARYENWVKS